ncbi:MAG: MFS transporter [Acidobacteria bacterium]|nr:MFS transporter [Acidobacteriota bacterium]MBI3471155.1 MFS transporter [Candidatus Solibacter usitatus]
MLSRVFKAFQYKDYRLLWMGACTSSVGTWMQKVAQSWLVFDISKSPSMLGLDVFLGEIPILMFSLVGGVVADRVDRRRVLLASQVVQLTCAFLLAGLVGLGVVQVWHILSLSFVVGTAQAFGGPAYQALVPSLVKPEDLSNAIALNSIQFNLARVIGPALGGIALTQLGASWCFSLNGVSFIAVIISLLLLHVEFIPKKSTERVLDSMKQGIGFIRRQGAMEALIVLAFCMTALGIPLLNFLPVIAKNVFHGGPTAFSLMLSVSGAGAVAGALVVAWLGNVKNKGRIALTMLAALGVGIVAFALSTTYWVSCVLLFVSGAALISVFAMIATLVQLITANEMRGRVMSVYNVAFRGGMPIGSLATGWLVEMYSAPPVLAVNGLLLFLLAVYYLAVQRRVAAL